MTQEEKNATQSEISTIKENIPTNSLELGTVMHFTVLEGKRVFSFVSPIDGYLNLLLLENYSHCTLQIQQRNYLLHEGENILIYVNKGVRFELESYCSDNRLLLMLFSCDKLLALQDEYITDAEQFRHGLVTKSDNRIALTQKQIIKLYKEKSCLNQLKIQTLLLELIINQIKGLSVDNEIKKITFSKNHFEKIQMVKQLINEDLSKNHTISDLAKAVGTNNQYLKKYFKQQYGKTVMNYMTEMKMEHAKKLILSGKYRITDVARMSGYKYSTHFTTAFKKYFGFVPNSLKYTLLLVHSETLIIPELLGLLKIV